MTYEEFCKAFKKRFPESKRVTLFGEDEIRVNLAFLTGFSAFLKKYPGELQVTIFYVPNDAKPFKVNIVEG